MPEPSTITTIASATDPRVAEARVLLLEYSDSLGIDLSYQNFDQELAEFPGIYLPPRGALLLADRDGELAGSVAMRELEADVSEMKRLYVRPDFRGLGIGYELATTVIGVAKRAGYRCMRLDTLPDMSDAQRLYRSLGFREIAPYYRSPVPGTVYLEIDL